MTHQHRSITTVAAAAGCLLLAACSSSSTATAGHASSAGDVTATARRTHPTSTDTPPGPAPATSRGSSISAAAHSVDACSLVTRQEASAAIGGNAGAPTGGGSECSYQSHSGSVTIIITPLPGSFDFCATQKTAPGYQDLPGIGDSACLTHQPGSTDLTFIKGSTKVDIVTSGNTTNPVISLARTAAARV